MKTSIIDTHEYLLDEWDYEKNNENNLYIENYTYGSHVKVWWICKKKP